MAARLRGASDLVRACLAELSGSKARAQIADLGARLEIADARSLLNAQAVKALNDDRTEFARLLEAERAEADSALAERDKLTVAMHALQAQYNDLAKRFSDVGAAREALLLEQAEYSGLRVRFDDLMQRFAAIVAARDYLQLSNAERSGVIEGLQAHYNALLQDNARLTEENAALKRGNIEQAARLAAADTTAERLRKHEGDQDAALYAVEQRVGLRVASGNAAENVCFAVPMKDGREIMVRAPVAPFAQRPSSFFVAYAKAGSVLFDALITEVAQAANVPWMNLTGQLFDVGYLHSATTFNWSKLFAPRGVAYIGFRNMPRFKLPLTAETPIGALVRDPRDMLVSAYYSQTKSHALPNSGPHRADIIANREKAQALSVDDFCRAHANDYIEALHHNRSHGMGNAKIFRYEDIIYRKADLVRDICKLMGVTLPRETMSEIARRHDVMPDKEQTGAHIRQVHPGNHRNKLKPETIEYLNGALREFLDEYGYDEMPEAASAERQGARPA